MQIDPALLSAASALLGALIGGGASLAAAIYTQRYQDRLQRVARETTKREAVYADFIMAASKLLLNTYVTEGFTLKGDEQHLIGLANRMRLFAPKGVIDQAERVIRGIVEIALQPSVDLRKLTAAALSNGRDYDLVLPFSLACRADLISCSERPSPLKPLAARFTSSTTRANLEDRPRYRGTKPVTGPSSETERA
jgi:hypothetical protein